jgi:hypothetical protein
MTNERLVTIRTQPFGTGHQALISFAELRRRRTCRVPLWRRGRAVDGAKIKQARVGQRPGEPALTSQTGSNIPNVYGNVLTRRGGVETPA